MVRCINYKAKTRIKFCVNYIKLRISFKFPLHVLVLAAAVDSLLLLPLHELIVWHIFLNTVLSCALYLCNHIAELLLV